MTYYLEDGTPCSGPAQIGQQLQGCILCGAPVVIVGFFRPTTAVGLAAVMRLRSYPVPEGHIINVAYGLCGQHARKSSLQRVEDVILEEAAKVVLQ